MTELVDLVEGEEVLTDSSELIWRQCAPGHLDKVTQLPTSEIFRPTSADGGKLSGTRQSKVGAQGAYEYRTVTLEKPSAGTWAVAVSEVEQVGSRVIDDTALQPAPPPPPPPGHVYIDLRHLMEEHRTDPLAKERFRSTLLIHAHRRGRQFPPADST